MPNEKYLLNFGGRELDSREFDRRILENAPHYVAYLNLKGDEKTDFYNLLNQTRENVLNGTWKVSDYGRIVGLDYLKNRYNKYGKRLEPGETSWKGEVMFDPAYAIETLFNGTANVTNELSPEDRGKIKWTNNSAGLAILNSIFGKGNVTDDPTTNSTLLANWADKVNDRYNGNSRPTAGRINFLKNILKKYLLDILNGVYDISNSDKAEEINKINNILSDNNIDKFELGTLGLLSLLFDREKFLTEELIAEMNTKALQKQTQNDLNDFISGRTDIHPLDKNDPGYEEAQKLHDATVEKLKEEEIDNEFINLPTTTLTALKSKDLVLSSLPNFEMNFSTTDVWKLWENLILNNKYLKGTDLDKMTKVSGSDKYLNKDNYITVALLHFANYLKKYLTDENRFSKRDYLIPDFIDWNNKRALIIQWQEGSNRFRLIERPVDDVLIKQIKSKEDLGLYLKLRQQYKTKRLFLKKEGGIIKFLEGGSTLNPLRYWFNPNKESSFQSDEELQQFYQDLFDLFHGANAKKEYYSNPSWNDKHLAMFSSEGLRAFEDYLEKLGGDDMLRGKDLAALLRASYVTSSTSPYDNQTGFKTNNTLLTLSDPYKDYLRLNIDLPEGITWDLVFGPEVDSVKYPLLRAYLEKYNNAVGRLHIIWGMKRKNLPNPNNSNDQNDQNDQNPNKRISNMLRELRRIYGESSQFRKHPGINPTDAEIAWLETGKMNQGILTNLDNMYILNATIPFLKSPNMVHYKQYTDKPLEDAVSRINAKWSQFGKFKAAGTSDQNTGTAYEIESQKAADLGSQPYISQNATNTRLSIDKENDTARLNNDIRYQIGEDNRKAITAHKNYVLQNIAATNKQNSDIRLANIAARQKGILERADYEYQNDREWSVKNDPSVILARSDYERLILEKRFNPASWNKNKAQKELELKAAYYRYNRALEDADTSYKASRVAPLGNPYTQWGTWYSGTYRSPFFYGAKAKNGGKMLLAEQERSRRAYEKMFYKMMKGLTDHLLKDSRNAYNYYRRLMMQDFKN